MRNLENENRTLESLCTEILELNRKKQDYIAPTNQLQVQTVVNDDGPNTTQIIMEADHGEKTKILNANDVCLDQMNVKNGLDTKVGRRLQTNYPKEYDQLTNAILEKEPCKRMIRSFNYPETTGQYMNNVIGTARAYLSDRFKTFDNSDLLESALPTLAESGACWKIVNYANTDKKLYIRLKSEIQTADAGVGDHMANGLFISNSEVGFSSIATGMTLWTLACLNGMQTEKITRKAHITSARNGDNWNRLTDETKDADNQLLKLQMRDIIASYGSREEFDNQVELFRKAKEDKISTDKNMNDAVEDLGKVMALSKKETSSVLEGLLNTIGQSGYEQGQPINKATLVNACTAVGNKAQPDDVDFWQRLGGKVLNLNKNDWNRVALAS